MTAPGIGDDLEFELAEVAQRLRHSARWLREKLKYDRDHRRPPRLQFHHRYGRKKLWTEAEYQALRAAIIAIGKEEEQRHATRPGSPSSSATGTGISTELCGSREIAAASARVQSYRPPRKTANTPRRSAAPSSAKSATKSSTVSNRRSRQRLRVIVTSTESEPGR